MSDSMQNIGFVKHPTQMSIRVSYAARILQGGKPSGTSCNQFAPFLLLGSPVSLLNAHITPASEDCCAGSLVCC